MPATSAPVYGAWSTQLQQQERFTVCISNNAREYGGGSACLKELLANADDAKATSFTICLDASQYRTDGLLHHGMAGLQGLALWVGNNAEFSSQDWRNYTLNVGKSAKANDSATTTRFGKGALTAYSLSDVIQVISGDDLLMLDPHGTHLPAQLQSVFGNLVNRKDDRFVDVAKECPGHLHSFQSFTNKCADVPSFGIRRHYPGTLFRLSLRSQEAALRSEISSESYTKDKFLQTLHTFIQAAPDLLLFTRHVKAISVYLKHSADCACEVLHECRASSSSISSLVSCQLQKVTVRILSADRGSPTNPGMTTKVWVKSTHIAIGRSEGNVAVLLQDDSAPGGNTLPKVVGKVYSIMALPLQNTNLPVHINGAFSMSADRRTLWAGEGDRGQVRTPLCLLCVKLQCTTGCKLFSINLHVLQVNLNGIVTRVIILRCPSVIWTCIAFSDPVIALLYIYIYLYLYISHSTLAVGERKHCSLDSGRRPSICCCNRKQL